MYLRFLRVLRSRHFISIGATSGFLYYSTYRGSHISYLDAPSASKKSQADKTAFRDEASGNVKVSASGKPLPTGASDEGGKAWFEHDDEAAWQSFSEKFAEIGASIANIDWANVGDKITDFIVPEWAQALPGYVRKLQAELEMAPGSLADEIWTESEDPYINPEITQTARVQVGGSICDEELAFREARRLHTAKALAKYLDVSESEVDPRDVPVIAMCGSGGGLRALVAGTSSYLSTQEADLFDCVTYTAGVSGSCWLQSLYYSSLGKQNHRRIIDHLKRRINVHIAFPPAALRLLTSAPTSKFLLSGLLEKGKGDPDADFGLVDVYGLLLAARLLVPRGELEVDPMDLKLSNQRRFIDDGTHPLPLYTMVRHEVPEENNDKKEAEERSYFSWWEMSPYYVWCEELNAGIPTWSLGRKFNGGSSLPRDSGINLPEMRIPLLLGIWGSAFCATLSHYYKEVRPVLQGIAGFGGIDALITEHNEDLVKHHPIDPASIPNFALGLEGQLPPTCPQNIFQSTHLRLMDAGMSNNLPIYPLLRPGRDVDIIVAFDASADIKKENWLSVADTYAQQHGIKGWPSGIGWPSESHLRSQIEKDISTQKDNSISSSTQEDDLGCCTIWLGTTPTTTNSSSASDSQTHPHRTSPSTAVAAVPSLPPSPSIRVPPNPDWPSLATPTSGLAVIYFPLLPNPKVPDVDPDKSEFMSTWNFIYTPEEIDKVAALARANFEEGKEAVRGCVRAVWERKRRAREEKERRDSEKEWWRRLREVGGGFG